MDLRKLRKLIDLVRESGIAEVGALVEQGAPPADAARPA